jgi:hypothetical protein
VRRDPARLEIWRVWGCPPANNGCPGQTSTRLRYLLLASTRSSPPHSSHPLAAYIDTSTTTTTYTSRLSGLPSHPLHNVGHHLAKLRLPPPQAVDQAASIQHHTHPQARPHTERAEQQWHRELLRDDCDAGHRHHRASHVLKEARRGRRWRVRQDMSVDQLQLGQLPRGTSRYARGSSCRLTVRRNTYPPSSRTTSHTHLTRPQARWSSLPFGIPPDRRSTIDCGRSRTPKPTSFSSALPLTAPTR